MTSSIETKDCDSLDEFWECISPIGDFFTMQGKRSKFIYRGQSNSAWELVPKVYRKDVINKYKVGMWETLKDYPGQAIFEYVLLSSFMNYCDSRGLPIPYDSPDFRRYFQFDTITREHGVDSRSWPNDHAIPLMALAQHHGIPTRLLDWSSNPYVACYFAAISVITDSNYNAEDRIAVFGLSKNGIPEFSINAKMPGEPRPLQHVHVPGSTSVNLAAQGGSFILVYNQGYRGHEFTPNVSLETKITDRSMLLKKVTLPKSLASELLMRCDKFGVSAASIFPGYDGAAKAALEGMLTVNLRRP